MLEHPRSSPPNASCQTRSWTEEHPCWLGRGTPPQSGQMHPGMTVQHAWPPGYYIIVRNFLGSVTISQCERCLTAPARNTFTYLLTYILIFVCHVAPGRRRVPHNGESSRCRSRFWGRFKHHEGDIGEELVRRQTGYRSADSLQQQSTWNGDVRFRDCTFCTELRILLMTFIACFCWKCTQIPTN